MTLFVNLSLDDICVFNGIFSTPRFVNGKDEHESLPMHVRQMFTLLDEKDFRVDISSTELRKKLEESR